MLRISKYDIRARKTPHSNVAEWIVWATSNRVDAFDERRNLIDPVQPPQFLPRIVVRPRRKPASMGVGILDDAEPDLPHVARTLGAAGGRPGGLNRGQQQANERADDRDHDEQFHEGKAASSFAHGGHLQSDCTIRFGWRRVKMAPVVESAVDRSWLKRR